MANRKKSSKTKKPDVDETNDAIVEPQPTDETTEVEPDSSDTAEADTAVSEDPSSDATETPDKETPSEGGDTADAETPVTSVGADETSTEPEDGTSDNDAANEGVDEKPVQDIPPQPVEQVIVREGGFVPMVIGGLAAAAIGFAVSRFLFPEPGVDPKLLSDLQNTIEAQASTIAELTERLDGLDGVGDTSALEAAQANLKDTVEGAVSNLSERIATLEADVAGIDREPTSAPTPTVDLSSYEAELEALRSTVDEMAENAAMIEKNAQAAAQATLQRAALTRIFSALDAGAGFEPAVADLQNLGVDVPDALVAASSGGVVPLSELQESFPDVARGALAASREALGGSDGAGLTSFLRSRLGARSLEPREGDDPDAVLSRVEAAIRDGRLSDALAELEALPEEGRAELSDWSSQVTLRQNAVAAAQDLGAQLN